VIESGLFANPVCGKATMSDPTSSFQNPFGNMPNSPIFTADQLKALQQQFQMNLNNNTGLPQNQTNTDSEMEAQPSSSVAAKHSTAKHSTGPSSTSSSSDANHSNHHGQASSTQQQSHQQPFFVMTQIPIQATPFAYSSSMSSDTHVVQPSPQLQALQEQQRQYLQNYQSNPSASPMPQPTPQFQALQQQVRQQQEQQKKEQLYQSQQAWEPNFENRSGNSNNHQNQQQHTETNHVKQSQASHSNRQQRPKEMQQQYQHQNSGIQPEAETSSNVVPSTSSNNTNFMLQQLMKNAYAAHQQQQQQNPNQMYPTQSQQQTIQQTSGNTLGTILSNSHTKNVGSESDSSNNRRLLLGSTVKPVQREESNMNVDFWKQFWDDEEKTSATSSDLNNTLSMQNSKRTFSDAMGDGSGTSFGSDDGTNANPLLQPRCEPQEQQSTFQSQSEQRRCPPFQQQNSTESRNVESDEDDAIAPTPLSEIRAKHFRMQTSQASTELPSPQVPHAQLPKSRNTGSSSSSMQSFHHQPIQPQLQHQYQQPRQQPILPSPSLSAPFLLPSTMMPPSLLASVYTSSTKATSETGQPKKKPVCAVSSKSASAARTETPQQVLERILTSRGYGSDIRIKAEQSNYDAMPSPLQLASFGTELVKAIHTSDVDKLSSLLACGLSPNPCNQFRDSIVDLVCKRGNAEIFRCLVDYGCDLRVCDGFGRTPLHHACWGSAFHPEIANSILRNDAQQILMEDKRGQTPLEYVREAQAGDWIDFLESHKDEYFPAGGALPAARDIRDSRPNGSLPNPLNALPLALAGALSSGQITPEKVSAMSAEERGRYNQR
jgi:hypothetical protein